MGQAIAFYTLSAFILGFAVLVVTAKDTVHSVLFLVLDFLFVAALYVLLGAEFLAVIQILVYAGGIVVLYLFVVMLVNLKRLPEEHVDAHRRTKLGVFLSAAVLAEFAAIAVYSAVAPGTAPAVTVPSARDSVCGEHGAGGLAAVHQLPHPVRDRVDAAAGRDDWGHCAGERREL